MKQTILWADDEMDLLKPYILFLENKNYAVITTTNGADAIEALRSEHIDIVFLDEQMPGLSGIDTLLEMKKIRPNIPIVMITKSEEESIMEEAIGSQITDYLIKPVSPNQILLSLKKNLSGKDIIGEKQIRNYMEEFRENSMNMSSKMLFSEWKELYKNLVYWELELYNGGHNDYLEILEQQKKEANNLFSKFIENNYYDLIRSNYQEPIQMSHNILHQRLFPLLKDSRPTFFIVVDNLRYDHWCALKPLLSNYLKVLKDDLYLGILPSVTQYARNALFSGLMPSEIEKIHPDLWVNETEDEQKNQYEQDLFTEYLRRYGHNVKFSFHKIFNNNAGKKIVDSLSQMINNQLNVIVYNSIDILSHASTDVQILKDMALSDQSYRSLALTWFEHSPLFDLLKQLSGKDVNIVITTDHGSVRATNTVRIKGDKESSVNLRYKTGKNLNIDSGNAFIIRHPADAFLPTLNFSSSFMFCKNNDYFVYPTNQAYYTQFFKNTLQHGGISMEELMIPFVILG
ncbi:two-component system response regulator [Bacteroidia bacterium]|nr:two-component system response regulator [Bacteroidia bacterium]